MAIEANSDILGHNESQEIADGDFLLIQKTSDLSTYKINASLLGAQPSSNYAWVPNFDYPVNSVVEYGGKFWKGLLSPNEGHVPTDGSLYWELVTVAPSGLTPWMANAVYTNTYVYVTYIFEDREFLFRLIDPVRPNATGSDFRFEWCIGKWELVGCSDYLAGVKGAHGWTTGRVLKMGVADWETFDGIGQPLGIVKYVPSSGTFIISTKGTITKGYTGLTIGATYWVDASGALVGIDTGSTMFVALTATTVMNVGSTGGGSGGETLDQVAVVPVASVATLDLNNKTARMFTVDPEAVLLAYVFTNDATALLINILQPVTAGAQLIFPSDVEFDKYESRWDDVLFTFLCDDTGQYEFTLSWAIDHWRAQVDGPTV